MVVLIRCKAMNEVQKLICKHLYLLILSSAGAIQQRCYNCNAGELLYLLNTMKLLLLDQHKETI